ncbi:Leucine-rich repeat-containing protein [Dirofilaria immitis]
MGNDPSKSKSSTEAETHGTSGKKKLGLRIKHGPSSSMIQRHLETAQKSRVLQLRNYGMKILPEKLQEVCEILRNLDVSQNKIRTLPTFIASFSNLKQLHLSNNELESLPDEMGVLKKLEILDLSYNHLNCLPESLAGLCSLKILNMSKNRFTHLPVCVCHMSALNILDLSSNFIEFLPDEVKFLKTSELNLNQNRLNSLNAVNLTHCEALRTLRVEENCLNKTDFISDFLINSNVSLIAYAGNLFQEKDFQNLPGYDEYQNRYTATKRKM